MDSRTQVTEQTTEIERLRQQVASLQQDLGTREAKIQSLTQDRDGWQGKYERHLKAAERKIRLEVVPRRELELQGQKRIVHLLDNKDGRLCYLLLAPQSMTPDALKALDSRLDLMIGKGRHVVALMPPNADLIVTGIVPQDPIE